MIKNEQGHVVVEMVVYGLAGGPTQNSLYIRECRPAYELAALILSLSSSSSSPYPSSFSSPSSPSPSWITQIEFHRLLNTLLLSLARAWSSLSVKYSLFLCLSPCFRFLIFAFFAFFIYFFVSALFIFYFILMTCVQDSGIIIEHFKP